mmetsp:Transcript_9325/g.18390  ORF Transcript_9325/g.18390 Transcript_9325/m.18390 type:complete len:502 (-) Transcript_9325:881-2386(-)
MREDNDGNLSIGNSLLGLVADVLKSRTKGVTLGLSSSRCCVGHVDFLGVPATLKGVLLGVSCEHGSHVLLGENGVLNHKTGSVLLGNLEEVGLRSYRALETHDDLLTDRVNGWVGNLGKKLLKVLSGALGKSGEDCERGINTHATKSLLATNSHRGKEKIEGLGGVAECVEAGAKLLVVKSLLGVLGGDGFGPLVEGGEVLLEPCTVVTGTCDGVLKLLVVYNALSLEVNEEELAGLEAALVLDGSRVERGQDTDLGRKDDVVIFGHVEAAGAETVAIEAGSDKAAVGKGHHGGAIPGLHDEAVVVVESLLGGRDVDVVLVGFRDHHHHGLGNGALRALDKELKHRVNVTRVGHVVGADGQKTSLIVVGEQGRLHDTTASVHPVLVTTESVDLSVVAKHTVGLCAVPTGEGVSGKTRMHKCEVRLEVGVDKIQVVLGQLLGGELTLVSDGPCGKTAHVEVLNACIECGGLCGLTHAHELALKDLNGVACGVLYEDLGNARL